MKTTRKFIALFLCVSLSFCMGTIPAQAASSIGITSSEILRIFSENGQKYIDGIDPGSTVKSIGDQLSPSLHIEFTDKNDRVLTSSDLVGTGTKIKLYDNDIAIDEATTIVYGDTNGDSVIDALDLLDVKKHLLRTKYLEGVYISAGCVKKDIEISAQDLLALKKHLLNMKKILQQAIPVDLSQKTITAAGSQIKMLGRSEPIGSSMIFDWSYSGFELSTYCEGDVTASITSAQSWFTYGFIQVVIDGVYDINNKIKISGTASYSLASGLSRGYHHIEVRKINEAQYSKAMVNSVTLNGILLTPPPKTIKMEFIGDSITCAEGALGNITQADSQDAYRGYAAITARHFNADANFICASSWGLYRGRIDPSANSVLPKIYDKTSKLRNSDLWDFNSYIADVVVVNLGTNDYYARSSNPFTDDEYKAALKSFNDTIRSKYPRATILYVYGMMLSGMDSLTIAAVNDIKVYDSKVDCVKLPQNNKGLNGHPDLSGHAAAAEGLIAKINEVLAAN